jgi:pyruvate/2-oxoglutarate dehydrogenase complex dihydrolipoamide dehydrogenase (E3) component
MDNLLATPRLVEIGPRLIGREDEDVSEAVHRILESEGIEIQLNSKCISLTKHESGIAVQTECIESSPEISGTRVLLAMGRTLSTHDLGLDLAGVAIDERGYILVDDHLQTNVLGIRAPGRL